MMNKRVTAFVVAILAGLPMLSAAQILGRGQEVGSEPTPAARGFFRRARSTPAPEATPLATPTPEVRRVEPERPRSTPSREVERPKAREAQTRKEPAISKPKTVATATPRARQAEATPKPDAATVARDRDISDTLKLVTDFLKAAHHGHYAEAARALTPPVQKYFEGEHSALGGGLKRVLDTITRDGTIRNVTSEATLRGDGARVESEIEYEDGSQGKWVFELLRTKEGWRIELDVPSVLSASKAKPSPKAAPTPVATPAVTPKPAEPASSPAPEAQAPPPAPTPQPALSDAPWKKAN